MQSFSIRADLGRLFVITGICFAFVVIGFAMLVSESRAINPGDVFWECVVALIVIIFFGGGGLFLLYTNQKPILTVTDDGLYYARHNLTINWSEITGYTYITKFMDQKCAWLALTTNNPAKYKQFEKINKKYKLLPQFANYDVIIVLDMTAQKDREQLINELTKRGIGEE